MKYEHIHRELMEWKEESLITPEQFEVLDNRYKPEEWELPRFYKKASSKRIMLFIMSMFVFLGTLAWISEFFRSKNVNLSNAFNDFITIGGIFFVVIGLLYLGDYLADKNLKVIRYIGKSVIVFGGLLTTFAVFYTDFKIFTKFGVKIFGNDWALFMLVSAIILWLISYKIRENVLLGYVISLLCVWVISEGQIHGGSYFGNWLGMTMPIRLILFSLIFILLGEFHNKREKIFKNTKFSYNYRFFSITYHVFGISIMFIASALASIGKILPNPILSIGFEMLIYLLISLGISLFTTCVLGLINNDLMYLKLGLSFFTLIVYANLYNVFRNNLGSPIFYIIIFIITILVAAVAEYTLRHRKELRLELIKSVK